MHALAAAMVLTPVRTRFKTVIFGNSSLLLTCSGAMHVFSNTVPHLDFSAGKSYAG